MLHKLSLGILCTLFSGLSTRKTLKVLIKPTSAPRLTSSSCNNPHWGISAKVSSSSQSRPGASPTRTRSRIAPTTTIKSRIFQIDRKKESS